MNKVILGIIIVLVIIAGGYLGSILLLKNVRSTRAEAMTQKYVINLYKEYSIIGLNCQGDDTDGDGYVSCDVRLQIGEDRGTEMVRFLSCPTLWLSFTGNTCKERVMLPTGN